MCGICMQIKVPFERHIFEFNLFDYYLFKSSHAEHRLNHSIQHGLFVQSFLDKRNIDRRGRDSTFSFSDQLLELRQSVLSIRGAAENFTEGEEKLLFNGEMWCFRGELIEGLDTKMLYQELKNSKNIVESLRKFEGDFALIFKQDNTIYVAKDYFGKKSLLLGIAPDSVWLSSVALGTLRCTPQLQIVDTVQKKYKAQYTASINKNWFELPPNSLITISLGQRVTWRCQQVHSMRLNPQINTQYQSAVIQALIRSSIKNTQGLLTSVLVLFSGGLDSSLIVLLLDKVLPIQVQIDLVTIAFKENSFDWALSSASFLELQALSKRKLNHIKRLVQFKQVKNNQKQLAQLIFPKNTQMDHNISAVLRLASQQQSSKAKVLFSGMGADELFGGYSRYRVASKRGEVREQMQFDLERLWIRNLGRDDRTISDSNRQCRYIFLDYDLLALVRAIPLQVLVDFSKEKGAGEKALLRRVGRRLGLRVSSEAAKKAIQFGTGLARESNIERWGSNRKGRGREEVQV